MTELALQDLYLTTPNKKLHRKYNTSFLILCIHSPEQLQEHRNAGCAISEQLMALSNPASCLHFNDGGKHALKSFLL